MRKYDSLACSPRMVEVWVEVPAPKATYRFYMKQLLDKISLLCLEQELDPLRNQLSITKP